MKILVSLLAFAAVVCAQAPQPAGDETPIFRVTVVSRTTRAISYRNRSGWTKVDLQGTALAPESRGHADVNSRKGYIEVKAKVENLQPATRYGPEYLTYVLWAITPEGRANNLGEILLSGADAGKIDVTTELQAFALLVTAEPYFGVTRPSDVVVMENIVRSDTVGKFEYVDAKYDLLKRGQYTMNVTPDRFRPIRLDTRAPLELFEAQNAVQIARNANADRYAGDVYQKANDLLHQAEAYELRKAGDKPVRMTAREAVQTAENARLIALKRQEEEALARERQAAADREAQAKAESERQARLKQQAEENQIREAERRRQAEEDRLRAERAKAEADRARLDAEAAAKRAADERAAAETARAEAEKARAAALAQQQQLEAEARRSAADADIARQQAAEAERLRLKAEQDQAQLRQQLLQQLNMILETRDTARGLIVNMSDVLFDTGRYTLRPGAREKLAKIAGIVLAHPGLKLDVEGHTDSVGGDAYNQRLSEQRADAVRNYLVSSGLNSANVTSRGFGKTQPVADNRTAAGRQRNRRVEMVVSGDVIGTRIESLKTTVAPAPNSVPPAAPVQARP